MTRHCAHGAAYDACQVDACEHSAAYSKAMRSRRPQTRCAQPDCNAIPQAAHDGQGHWFCIDHTRIVHTVHGPTHGSAPRKGAGMVSKGAGVDEQGEHARGAADWPWRPPTHRPDEHHDVPYVLNKVLMFQQAPPVHCDRSRPESAPGTHLPRLGPTEEEAALRYLENLDTLNARERVVLQHRTAGYTGEEIAKELELSPRQVRTAIESGHAKLRVLEQQASASEGALSQTGG